MKNPVKFSACDAHDQISAEYSAGDDLWMVKCKKRVVWPKLKRKKKSQQQQQKGLEPHSSIDKMLLPHKIMRYKVFGLSKF